MKRLICCCLIVAVLLGLSVATAAKGNETVTVTANKTKMNVGDLVVFTVKISNADPVRSCTLTLDYPADVFELKDIIWEKNPDGEEPGKNSNQKIAEWNADTNINGTLAQFVLKVKQTAAAGSWHEVGCVVTVTGEDVDVPQTYGNVSYAVVTMTCSHPSYAQVESGEYIAQAGNCSTPATYYESCTVCGTAGSKTFVGKNGANHDFSAQVESEKYLAQAGNCSTPALYYKSCANCGAAGEETFSGKASGDHDFSAKVETEEYLSDMGDCQNKRQYYYSCAGCGEKGVESFVSEKKFGVHIYNNGCDSECNVCGKYQEPTHETNGQWASDETGHWMLCGVCGEKVDLAAHEPGPEATTEEHQLCTVCDYVLAVSDEHQHEYSQEWSYDEKSHWHECSCTGKSDLEVHSWSVVETEDAEVLTAQCTVCGAAKEEPVTTVPDDTNPSQTTSPTQPTQSSQPQDDDGGVDAAVIVLTILLVLSLAGNGVLAWMLFGNKKKPVMPKKNKQN